MYCKDALNLAERNYKINKKYLARLKQRKIPKLDYIVQSIHTRIFSAIDCLSCTRCCTHIEVPINETDVTRISKHLKQRPIAFKKIYCKIDEDGNMTFLSIPCPFFDSKNGCTIYPIRPRECRDFPYTDQKNFKGHMVRIVEKSLICPGLGRLIEELKKEVTL